MKKNGFAPILIILIVVVLGYFMFRNSFNNYSSEKVPSLPIKSSELVGIWQANNMMADNWADRYHFYADGKFHFYPNMMGICGENTKALDGAWKLNKSVLSLTFVTEVKPVKNCFVDITKNRTDLKQPYTRDYNFLYLGNQPGDSYKSILFDGRQYWQFSVDPTKYYPEDNYPE